MPNYAPGFPIDDTETGDSIFNEAEKLKKEFVKLYDCLNEVVNMIVPNLLTNAINSIETIPSNLIAIWSGSGNTVPIGWRLCDGTNNTPDLRDKFIIGAGNEYKVGNIGGENSHILTEEEMPKHKHAPLYGKYNKDSDSHPGTPNYYNASQRWLAGDGEIIDSYTGFTGGGKPHNNMPPYYALCYIMKV